MILVMKTTSYYVFALLVVWQALSSWLIGWLVVGSLVAPSIRWSADPLMRHSFVVVDKSGIERYIKRAEEGADGVKTGQTRCARTVTLLMLGKNGSDSRSLCLPSSFQTFKNSRINRKSGQFNGRYFKRQITQNH
ncbi:Type II restriction enzyme BanI [Dirofilaria immitis]